MALRGKKPEKALANPANEDLCLNLEVGRSLEEDGKS
jgi:hypothetical protein